MRRDLFVVALVILSWLAASVLAFCTTNQLLG